MSYTTYRIYSEFGYDAFINSSSVDNWLSKESNLMNFQIPSNEPQWTSYFEQKQQINVRSWVNEKADLTLAVFSSKSIATNTTKTFTGESSLTGAIVQTRAAAAWILLAKTKAKKVEAAFA